MHLAYETLEQKTKQPIANLELITYNPFLYAEGEARPNYRLAPKALKPCRTLAARLIRGRGES